MTEQLLDARFRLWLRGLPRPVLYQLALDYRQAALQAGLKIFKADDTEVAIPPSLTPVVEVADRFTARSLMARHLLSGVAKAVRYYQAGAGRPEADAVFAGLSIRERQLIDANWELGEQVATARVDLFTEEEASEAGWGAGSDRPLEMNATIPAMQGYGDIVNQAFLLAVCRHAGLSRERAQALADRNGSNVDDLRRSLSAHLARLEGGLQGRLEVKRGGKSQRPSVAVVARSGDAQSAELAYIVRQFNAAGMVAYRCTPEQLSFDDRRRPRLLTQPIDLVYRHVFVRAVVPGSPFDAMLDDPVSARLLNPPNSQLEVKAIFAALSEAAGSPAQAAAFGLTPAEVSAAQRIPWNRRLKVGPSTGFDHEPVADLLTYAAGHGESLVLKRSWGYGGTSVLLGDELDSEAGQAKARELAGSSSAVAPGAEAAAPSKLSWPQLLSACAQAGGFVLQRKVTPRVQSHLVAGDGFPAWTNWYVDVSAFTNLGVDFHPSGGVRRGSVSRVVNIVGGGGLVPAIRAEVMAEMLEAIGI